MKNNLNLYCVYCHTSPSGRKYVGISSDPKKRWSSGKGYSKNYIFYRAIKKYGWDNIKHEVLFDNLTETEASNIEARLVREWNLTDRRYGYNIREGGSNGAHSERSRKLMSASRMGNKNSVGRTLPAQTRALISASLREYYAIHGSHSLGRHHSEETIQKLKSRVFTEETRAKMSKNHQDVSGAKNPSARPVRQLSLTGEPIAEYDYAKQACEKYGIDLSQLIKCCRGKAKTCGGFRWEYK